MLPYKGKRITLLPPWCRQINIVIDTRCRDNHKLLNYGTMVQQWSVCSRVAPTQLLATSDSCRARSAREAPINGDRGIMVCLTQSWRQDLPQNPNSAALFSTVQHISTVSPAKHPPCLAPSGCWRRPQNCSVFFSLTKAGFFWDFSSKYPPLFRRHPIHIKDISLEFPVITAAKRR